MRVLLAILVWPVLGLAQTPPAGAPAWVHQPTRTVDGGYIVFVGTGVNKTVEMARFKAQGMALQDLVSECTLPPLQTRLEDSYDEHTPDGIQSYSKISIQYPDCEEAKRALGPDEIKKLANPQLSTFLKRYQDLLASEGDDSAEEVDPTQDETVVVQNDDDLYHVQEEVAAAKAQVILAPPGMYYPGSSETVYFQQIVIPRTIRIREYEVKRVPVATPQHSWSTLGLHNAYHHHNTFRQVQRTAQPQGFKAWRAQARPRPVMVRRSPGRPGRPPAPAPRRRR